METKNLKANWQKVLKLCLECKKEKELNELLDLLLTYEERDAIALRYAIIKELVKGDKTQREIADSLGVSIAKITRGSNYLKTISKDLKAILGRKMKEKGR